VPVDKLKEKNMKKKNIFFASLKSIKKVVGSGVGSASISQRYGSAPKCHESPTLLYTYKSNCSGSGRSVIIGSLGSGFVINIYVFKQRKKIPAVYKIKFFIKKEIRPVTLL